MTRRVAGTEATDADATRGRYCTGRGGSAAPEGTGEDHMGLFLAGLGCGVALTLAGVAVWCAVVVSGAGEQAARTLLDPRIEGYE